MHSRDQKPIDAGQWPSPLAAMLAKIREADGAAVKHNQILFTLGFVLRFLSALFVSLYLRNRNAVDVRIDHCIITDLRRPSYGNLLRFLRACIKADFSWEPLDALADQLQKLFKIKHSGLPLISKETPLLDAFISYRNRVAHGGAAIDNATAEAQLPPLQTLLSVVLEHMMPLSRYAFVYKDGFYLSAQDHFLAVIPLAKYDSARFIGIMEGYDSRKKTLRFVSPEQSWESADEWSEWELLLQERGLLPLPLDKIDKTWLQNRARALIPATFQPPPGLISASVTAALRKCIEADGLLRSNDPLLAAISLITNSDKICFVLDPQDKCWSMEVYIGFANLVGVASDIGSIPDGHFFEELAGEICVLIIPAAGTTSAPDWRILQYDFPGLEVITLKQSHTPGNGYTFTASLRQTIFNAFAKENNLNLTWNDVPESLAHWIDSVEKIRFVVQHWPLIRADLSHPVTVWSQYLADMLGELSDASLIEDFAVACSDLQDISHKTAIEILLDLGLVGLDAEGTPRFDSEFARAGLYCRVLHCARARQRRRLASHPPLPHTIEIARTLDIVARSEPIELSDSPGLTLLAAYRCIDDPQDLFRFHSGDPQPDVFAISVLLVNWGYPHRVDAVLSGYWSAVQDQKIGSTSDALAVATAVRKHGSAELALQIFERLGQQHPRIATRARHEMAGILRDRGRGEDRKCAEQIYNSILSQSGLDSEQRVRSCAGAAENFYLQHRYDEATTLLEDALSKTDEPRLQAILYHRLAATRSFAGDYERAMEWSTRAIDYFDNTYSGGFASRCLDTHARLLSHLDRHEEALDYLMKSLEIKRAFGDRRGLQIGLLFLSTLQSYSGIGHAESSALEALNLAQRSNDIAGQIHAHKRLAVLKRENKAEQKKHRLKIKELENITRESP